MDIWVENSNDVSKWLKRKQHADNNNIKYNNKLMVGK